MFAACLLVSCGDDGGDSPPDDAGHDGAAASDGATGTPDASVSGGTQGPNQLCEVLDDGGPYCIEGLTCCADKVCKADCGGTGAQSCDGSGDCNGSNVCCDVDDMIFCTTAKACSDFGGTEIP